MRWLLMCALVAATLNGPALAQAQNRVAVPAPNWCLHEGRSVWRDRNANAHELARVTLDIGCDAGVVTGLRVKAETRCGRTLCTWRYAEQTAMDGPILQALFFTFTATRLVELQLLGNQITANVYNEYNQEGRPSQRMTTGLTLED